MNEDSAPGLLSGLDDAPTTDPADDGLDHDRPCEWKEGCDSFIPLGTNRTRHYCDYHSALVAQKSGANKRKRAKGDAAPTNVTVQIGGGAKGGRTGADKRVAAVTAGATQMAQTFAAIIGAGGDLQCASTIAGSAAAWGQAIGELSRYQPALEKVFAPTGAATGQGLAWIAAIAATAGIAVPVLAHHNLISPAIAEKFAVGTMVAGGVTGSPTPDASAAA